MDDLISRQAAIDAVNDVIVDYIPIMYGRFGEIPLELALAIERLPTAEQRAVTMKPEIDKDWLKKAMEDAELTLVAEPRKGRWIDGNEGKWNTAYCPKCSVCGTPFYGIETVRYHYCPNCGAKMDGEDDG